MNVYATAGGCWGVVRVMPFFSLGVNKFDVVWRRAGAGCAGCERPLIYAACVGGSISHTVSSGGLKLMSLFAPKKRKRKNKVGPHSGSDLLCARR
jgi:hypothetical protein